MKKVVLFVLIILLAMPTMAVTLTGGVIYTVETARNEAFADIEYNISVEPYKKFMVDKRFKSAKNSRASTQRKKTRRLITFFSDGTYGIKINNCCSIYYDENGNLLEIELGEKRTGVYPYLTRKYDREGKLNNVFYNVAYNESYVYDVNKNLVAHWIGKNCYDENGKIEYIRK